MKSIVPRVLAAMLAGMAYTISYAQEKLTEDDLLGEWIFPGNGSVIRAHRCGDRFCGSDIKVKAPRLSDNAQKRSRPAILIPSNLEKRGPTTWHGKLVNIRDGDSYEGTITLIDKNRLTLVRCIIGSVLCETVTFQRMDPPRPPEPQEREHRAVPADQLKAARPSPKPKTTALRPTQADFEAFLRERGTTSAPPLATQDKQMLFEEFLAWRRKQ
jgi:uncharacterized protein (DUF2147 family)